MVAFGEKLAAEKHGLWAERSAYLNYGLLKSKIEVRVRVHRSLRVVIRCPIFSRRTHT